MLERESEISWSNRIFLLILFSLLAAFILTPLISNYIIPGNLDFQRHLLTITQAKTALTEGQFPLRMGYYHEWRYPIFQFYSPTSYTLAGLIDLAFTPSNPMLAEKILLWIFLVIAGIYVYRLAFNWVHSVPAAILSAVAYLTMPYYLIVINYIGAMNEAIALGMIPAVLYYTLQRYTNPADTSTLLKSSLAWYLLITIHLVTFVAASFFIGLLLFLATYKNRHWINLLDTGMAYVFGCFLAAWYLMPVALMHHFFLINNSFDNQTFYKIYEVFAADLFSLVGSVTQGIKSPDGAVSILTRIHPNLGLPILFAASLSLLMVFKKFNLSKNFDFWLPILLFVFAVALILAWSPINFWRWLPSSFFIFQYTWRLLGQLMWIGALLFAGTLCWLFKNKLNEKHTVTGVILLLMLAMTWFPTQKRGYTDLSHILKNASAYNLDYLINTTQAVVPVQINKLKNLAELSDQMTFATYQIDPAKTFTVKQIKPKCRQEKTDTICQIYVPEKVNLIELPVLAYADMLKITVNGQTVGYRAIVNRDFFIAAITPQSGQWNTIKIRFTGIPLANELSTLFWIIWTLFFALSITKPLLLPKTITNLSTS